MQGRATSLTAALALGLPVRLSAEVMDKEPSVGHIWLAAILLGLCSLLTTRYSPWRAMLPIWLASSALAGALCWEAYAEVTDPFLGAIIRYEAGPSYVPHALAAAFVFWSLHVVGVLVRVGSRGKGSRGPRPA